MSERTVFTVDQAGERVGIDWDASPFDGEQFRWGWTSNWNTGK